MSLRKLQKRFQNIIDDIISGSPINKIICNASPGSGKSLLPILAGKLITAGLADSLCWVVPRLTLAYQAETNFAEIGFRKLLKHDMAIRSATNDVNPCRGLSGFSTTYHALAMDNEQTVLSDFKRKRYILILDEFHHVSADADIAWHQAIKPLVEYAKYLVLMTGTMARGDGKKIAFVRYDQDGEKSYPQTYSDKTTAVIEHTRKDALAEKAILPLSFHLSSGSAEWINKDGAYLKSNISQASGGIAAQALLTAISTEFAASLLEKGLSHWAETKKYNKGAKLLVVTANYEEAKKISKILKDKWLNSEIATSHEPKQAHQAIKRFKRGTVDILVTIAMAYEGLDCPPITHIICLTNIRSIPWIEQMVARAVRIDTEAGTYESQLAYIFAPDDICFREIVSKIKQEQKPFVKMHEKTQMDLFDSNGSGDGEGVPNIQIQPLSSSLNGHREIFLGNKEKPPASMLLMTPSEIEASLRKQIEKHVRLYSFNNRHRGGEINAEIKAHFEKTRAEMDIPELKRTCEYLQGKYPLSVMGRGSGRGRVQTKVSPWP